LKEQDFFPTINLVIGKSARLLISIAKEI